MNRNRILTFRRLTILTMFALATVEVWQTNLDNSDLESQSAKTTESFQIARQVSPGADQIRDNEPL